MKLKHLHESRLDEYVNGVMNMKLYLADGTAIPTLDPRLSSKGDVNLLRQHLDEIIALYGDGQMPGLQKKWKHRQDRVMWVMKYLKYGMAVEYADVVDIELKARANPKLMAGRDMNHRSAGNIWFCESRFGQPPSEKQPDIEYVLKKYGHLRDEAVFKGSPSIYRMCKWFAKGGNNDKNALGDLLHTMVNYHDAAPNNALERIVWQDQSLSQIIDQCNVQIKKLEEFFKDACPQQGEMLLDMGDGTSWWDLQSSYVPAEGHAMGHCGNVQRVDGEETLISYREMLESNGMRRMRPMLTFIYHFGDGGYFGEMKGRANLKPTERYHRAIVEMLKLPRWNKVVGTKNRHSPEQNFCLFNSPGMNRPARGWTDLAPNLAKELHDAHPTIWQYNGACQYCANVYPGWERAIGNVDKDTYRCAKEMGIEDAIAKKYRKKQDSNDTNFNIEGAGDDMGIGDPA